MEDTQGTPLCFPNLNSSCRRLVLRPYSETVLLYMLLACISLLTMTLNLFVIISIGHFRQLQTPTNILLLSLAVSDLLVGLLVMPIESLRYMETCWLLGKLMCALTPLLSYCLVSVSLGNMVLISIDRYVAICEPLLYSSKVTLTKVKISVGSCWVCSLLYNGLILMDHLTWPDRFNSCQGECVVVLSHILGTVDLFVTFIGPCTIMVVLYMRVFLAALSQMRLIHTRRSAAVGTTNNNTVLVKVSEMKAARTLGILITVFLICVCPYFYPSLVGSNTSNSLSYFAALSWLLLINSCINPLIYVSFYPWFRKSVRLILTLEVLKPHCREPRIL
ncbi:trace amine-associated receptor 13c-like [Cynoglossus semilaevis]|nr:trace amine-associated receptor 13c-like [Cynoglossus semilaevis]